MKNFRYTGKDILFICIFLGNLLFQSFSQTSNDDSCLFKLPFSVFCHDCSSNYYRESGNLNEIDPSFCKKRENSKLFLEIFIKNSTCDASEPCDGSDESPFDSLERAFSEAHQKSNHYVESEIFIYLLGENHFIVRTDIPEPSNHYFRGVNASVEISPLLCVKKNLPGCFMSESEKSIIFLKRTDFHLFASNNLKIRNLVIEAPDIHLSGTEKEAEDCLGQKKICCDLESLNSHYEDSVCGLRNRPLKFIPIKGWTEKFGLFNLIPLFASSESTYISPTLIIENCSFKNIYPPNENVGLASLIVFAHTGGGMIFINNSVFENLRFLRGIFWASDYAAISPSPVENEQNTYLISQKMIPTIFFQDCVYEKYDMYQLFGVPQGETASLIILENFSGDILINRNIFKNLKYESEIYKIFTISSCSNVNFIGAIFQDPFKVSLLDLTDSYLLLKNCSFIRMNYYKGIISKWTQIFVNDSLIGGTDQYATPKYFVYMDGGELIIGNTSIFKNFFLVFRLYESKKFTLQDCSIQSFGIKRYSFLLLNTPLALLKTNLSDIFESGEAYLFWIRNSGSEIFLYYINTLRIRNYTMDNTLSLIFFNDRNSKEDELICEGLFIERSPIRRIFYITELTKLSLSNSNIKDMISQPQGVSLFTCNSKKQIIKIMNLTLINVKTNDYYFISSLNCESECEFYMENVFWQNVLFRYIEMINLFNMQRTVFTNLTIRNPSFQSKLDIIILSLWSGKVEIKDVTIEIAFWKCGAFIESQTDDISIYNLTMVQLANSKMPCLMCRIRSGDVILRNITLQNIFGYTDPREGNKNGVLSFYYWGDEYFRTENEMRVWLYDIRVEGCQESYFGLIGFINVDKIFLYNISITNDFNTPGTVSVGGGISMIWVSVVNIEMLTIINKKTMKFGALHLKGVIEGSIKNSTIINTTSEFGGAVGVIESGLVLFQNIKAFNCVSYSDGGLFLIQQTKVDIVELYAEKTAALQQGGVVNFIEGNLTISNSNFTGIKSSKGGLLYLEGDSYLNLTGIQFIGGTAYFRGVFAYFHNVVFIDCTNITIKNVESPETDGNIYFYNDFIVSYYSLRNFLIQKCFIKKGNFLFMEGENKIKIENLVLLQNGGLSIKGVGLANPSLEIKNLKVLENGLFGAESTGIFDIWKLELNLSGTAFFINNSFSSPLLLASFSKINFADSILEHNYHINSSASLNLVLISNTVLNLTNLKCTNINGLSSFLSSFQSTIQVKGCLIKYCVSENFACLNFEQSQLIMTDTVVDSTKNALCGALYLFSSSAKLTRVNLSNGTSSGALGEEELNLKNILVSPLSKVLTVKNSGDFKIEIRINEMIFKADNPGLPVAFFSKALKIEVINCVIEAPSEFEAGLGFFLESSNIIIINTVFKNLKSWAGSAIKAFNGDAEFVSIIEVYKSKFIKNLANVGSAVILVGKIIGIFEMNIFEENKALNTSSSKLSGIAGCIYFSCLDCPKMNLTLRNNTFKSNTAEYFSPTVFSQAMIFSDSNIFEENKDEIRYTTNISCFPLQKSISELEYTDKFYQGSHNYSFEYLISGPSFNFSLRLYDFYGQTLLFDWKSQSILKTDSKAIISMEFFKNKGGFHDFSSVRIFAKPNSSIELKLNIEFNEEELFPFILERHPENNLSLKFKSFFRPCIRGELYIFGDSRCELCKKGEYSIDDPMTQDYSLQKCSRCPENAECLSGDKITPFKGFWRSSENSTNMVECLASDACLGTSGGLENYNIAEMVHGKCADHHKGPLCFLCDESFVKLSGTGLCKDCRNDPFFYVKFVFAFGFIIVYVLIQMRLVLKYSGSAYAGILLKQLITHFQQISLISVLPMGWTPDFKSYFFFLSYVSFVSDELLSFDCFSAQLDANSLAKTVFVTILLPIVMTIVISVILLLEHIIKRCFKRESSLKFFAEDVKVCFIVVAYILFPDIARKCFSLLNCIEVDNINQTKLLRLSPDIECWSSSHQFYIFALGIPGFLAWEIFYPLGLLIIMNRNKSKLKKSNMKKEEVVEQQEKSVIIPSNEIIDSMPTPTLQNNDSEKRAMKLSKRTTLYGSLLDHDSDVVLKFIKKGYFDRYYYWELVIFAKKIVLIFIGSFTEFLPDELKATLLLVIISIFLLLQVRIQPYEKKRLEFN